MIFIIIITLLVPLSSSQRTHILSVGALINAAGSFHVHTLQDNYYMKEQENEKKQVQKISGLDENEEKQGFIVEKFRSLLGLKSFHKRVPSKSNGDSDSDSDQFLTPSPSPSQNIEAEVEAPAPAPTPSQVMHFHPHSYHQKHHFHWNQPPKKLHHDDRGRTKRILVAVFVSVGVAAFVISLGLILFCRKKFTNHKKKKPKRTMPLCSSNTKGKTKGKVSLNPGLDLFYLDALGEDVEQHACTLTKTSDNNVSSSFTKEIVSVHEEELVIKNEHECVDKIVHEDCDSSEDESFHSFVDSQSNTRLSNASAGSLSDTQSLLLSPQNSFSLLPNQLPSSPQNTNDSHQPPYSPKQKDQDIENETFVQCPQTSNSSPPPPPPPPPTPPLKMPLFTLHSLTTSSRVSSHSPLSLTSHTLSSPVNSETSSRSNLSPEKDSFSPSSSNPTKSPPPPPCPPPFPRGNSNKNAKTPPPPPYQFPQSPLGKDGTPLAKLKPLHWDKVRAAPNRTMVWDKLRSSSFE